MNRCPEHIVDLMHTYLDGDIRHDEEADLRAHLSSCQECRTLMDELKETVLLFNQVEPIPAPAGFTKGVMQALPKQKKTIGFSRFLRRHPMLVAAAMFLVLMSATLFSSYGNTGQLSYTKQPDLIVDGSTITVPAGKVIDGDLTIKNGHLIIEGQVNGNVTVIKGSKYQASSAVVTGEIQEIDEVFDWLWYKIKSTVQGIFQSDKEEK